LPQGASFKGCQFAAQGVSKGALQVSEAKVSKKHVWSQQVLKKPGAARSKSDLKP